MYFEAQMPYFPIQEGSTTVKLESKLKNAMIIAVKKKVFVLLTFSLMGYDSSTAAISLILNRM